MGVDISMHIVSKDGELKYQDIFDGRDTRWFDNISHNVTDDIYESFPSKYGLPENSPEIVRHAFEHREEGFYDFFYVSVEEFMKWFLYKRPDIDAGWVCTYDKWLYEKKGVIPELAHYLDKELNPNDYHFIEVEGSYEGSRWVYEFITNHNDIHPEDNIVYYFDC